MKLKGKVVLVTGASGGIGAAAAHRLAARGARLVLVARRLGELERVQREIVAAHGGVVSVIQADMVVPKDRLRIGAELERLGELHVLVHNAGIMAHGRFDATNLSVLRRTLELNFFAVAELTQLLLPVMRRSVGDKAILFVSTPSGLYGIPERFAYSASKAAGHMLFEALGAELRGDGFRTTVFCPGYTRTNLRTSGLAGDGKVLAEGQARGAKSAEFVGERLCRAIEKGRRIAFTDFNGHAVFWLRTFAPGLLEWAALRKG